MNRLIAPALLVASVFLSGYTFYETTSPAGGKYPLRWYRDQVEISIDKNLTRDVEKAEALAAVVESINTWNNVECPHAMFLNLGEVSRVKAMSTDSGGVRSGNNIIIFENSAQWDGNRTGDQSFDTSLTIALSTMFHVKSTGEIKTFAVEFNDDAFEFGTLGISDQLDIQNTLTHELGHVLGLNHAGIETPGYWDQTMYYQAAPGETEKRTLEADDKAGVCYVYSTDWAGLLDQQDTGCSASGVRGTETTVDPLTYVGLAMIPLLLIIYRRRAGRGF